MSTTVIRLLPRLKASVERLAAASGGTVEGLAQRGQRERGFPHR